MEDSTRGKGNSDFYLPERVDTNALDGKLRWEWDRLGRNLYLPGFPVDSRIEVGHSMCRWNDASLNGQDRFDYSRQATSSLAMADVSFHCADMQRTVSFLPALIHAIGYGVDLQWIANSCAGSVAFKVPSQPRIEVTASFVGASDDFALASKIGMRYTYSRDFSVVVRSAGPNETTDRIAVSNSITEALEIDSANALSTTVAVSIAVESMTGRCWRQDP